MSLLCPGESRGVAFLLHIRSTTLTVILVNSGEFASPGLWFFYCNERTIELLAPRVKAPSELLRALVSLSDVDENERENWNGGSGGDLDARKRFIGI